MEFQRHIQININPIIDCLLSINHSKKININIHKRQTQRTQQDHFTSLNHQQNPAYLVDRYN